MKVSLIATCGIAMVLIVVCLVRAQQPGHPGLAVQRANVVAVNSESGSQRIVNPLMTPPAPGDPLTELHRNIDTIVPNASEDHIFYNLPSPDSTPNELTESAGYVRGFQAPLDNARADEPEVVLPWARQTAGNDEFENELDSATTEFENMFAEAYNVMQPDVPADDANTAVAALDSAIDPESGIHNALRNDTPEVRMAGGNEPFNQDFEFELLPDDPSIGARPDAIATPNNGSGNFGDPNNGIYSSEPYDANNTYTNPVPYIVDDNSSHDAYGMPSEIPGMNLSHDNALIGNVADTAYDELLWWKPLVVQPLNETNRVEQADTNSLIYKTLQNSPRIQSISKNPLIRELQIAESRAAFDPVKFLRTQWEDRNDPVGNELTTGNGELFLRDNIWSATGGVKRKLTSGGDVEINQRLGFQNSNSRFFSPQDQGTATLSLNFSQPLMRGRGQAYNKSQILIAQTTTGAAWESFQTELQDELQSVVEAYWQLYYERSVFIQKKRNVVRGMKILDMLEGRAGLDSLPNQITRARSAVQSRKTSLANAFRDVRNSETEIRRLMADPDWIASQTVELLPVEPAVRTNFEIPLDTVIYTAMESRPEIKESLRRAKIAAIQHDVSANELLPDLSLLLNTYISALEGDTGIERAFTGQFANSPGYSVGFEFEVPISNRAARSRLAQRKVQLSKIQHEVNEVLQNVIAESQIAHRRVISAWQTMDAARISIDAALADVQQNQRRWDSFGLVEGDLADGHTPTTILDQLLDSQDRLANAELIYAQSELELKLAEVGLRRAMGTTLQHEKVVYNRQNIGDVPHLGVAQAAAAFDIPLPTEVPRYPINQDGVPVEGVYAPADRANVPADGSYAPALPMPNVPNPTRVILPQPDENGFHTHGRYDLNMIESNPVENPQYPPAPIYETPDPRFSEPDFGTPQR